MNIVLSIPSNEHDYYSIALDDSSGNHLSFFDHKVFLLTNILSDLLLLEKGKVSSTYSEWVFNTKNTLPLQNMILDMAIYIADCFACDVNIVNN
jgi:hypothetical protein